MATPRSDRQYAEHAKEVVGQLDTLWGHDGFPEYRKRLDSREPSRALLQSNSAKNYEEKNR